MQIHQGYLWKKRLQEELNSTSKSIGLIINYPLKIANAFNEYFGNIGPELASKIPISPDPLLGANPATTSMFLNSVTDQEMAKIIDSLSNKHSSQNKIYKVLLKKIKKTQWCPI